MTNITPTYDVKETAQNAREFVKQNKSVIWNVFKPFVMVLLVLFLFDVVMRDVFLSDAYAGFNLGSIISVYFMTIIMISYYRLVMKGTQIFVPTKMFQPTESELLFVVMFFVFFAAFSLSIALLSPLLSSAPMVVEYILIAVLILVQAVILYRVSFYFVGCAIDEEMDIKKSVQQTSGFVIRIVVSFLFASWRVFGIVLLCFSFITLVSIVFEEMEFPEIVLRIFTFITLFPLMVYITPILMTLHAYVVSNYYVYAQQNNAPESTP